MYVLYSAVITLQRLDVVEAQRDHWQRPAEVLRALDVRDGNVVADLGSGAGYFTLKISPIVGKSGQVLAVDIRKLSLLFLWIRAVLRTPHNIQIIIGEADDPHLPTETVDAVLIANTYHEFLNPRMMLDHAFRSLRSGGRLVIVDRGPRAVYAEESREVLAGHEIPLSAVDNEVRKSGFEITGREDPFIDRAGDDPWWLLTARKP
jgi:ubiquinone/menaquinone biosynthesis C-methylase UbiE